MIARLPAIVASLLTVALALGPALAPQSAHAANRAADKVDAKQAEILAAMAK